MPAAGAGGKRLYGQRACPIVGSEGSNNLRLIKGDAVSLAECTSGLLPGQMGNGPGTCAAGSTSTGASPPPPQGGTGTGTGASSSSFHAAYPCNPSATSSSSSPPPSLEALSPPPTHASAQALESPSLRESPHAARTSGSGTEEIPQLRRSPGGASPGSAVLHQQKWKVDGRGEASDGEQPKDQETETKVGPQEKRRRGEGKEGNVRSIVDNSSGTGPGRGQASGARLDEPQEEQTTNVPGKVSRQEQVQPAKCGPSVGDLQSNDSNLQNKKQGRGEKSLGRQQRIGASAVPLSSTSQKDPSKAKHNFSSPQQGKHHLGLLELPSKQGSEDGKPEELLGDTDKLKKTTITAQQQLAKKKKTEQQRTGVKLEEAGPGHVRTPGLTNSHSDPNKPSDDADNAFFDEAMTLQDCEGSESNIFACADEDPSGAKDPASGHKEGSPKANVVLKQPQGQQEQEGQERVPGEQDAENVRLDRQQEDQDQHQHESDSKQQQITGDGQGGGSTGSLLQWSPEEETLLEQGLALYPADKYPPLQRYLKIAATLPAKTARDVALRCRWMQSKASSKRRRLDDPTSMKKKKDKGGETAQAGPSLTVGGAAAVTSRAASSSSGLGALPPGPTLTMGVSPPALAAAGSHPWKQARPLSGGHAPATSAGLANTAAFGPTGMMPATADGAEKAAGAGGHAGAAARDPGKLLEVNRKYISMVKANIAACKPSQENNDLLGKLRDNILCVLHGMTHTPGVMSQMPPLPVKLNLELAAYVLKPYPLP